MKKLLSSLLCLAMVLILLPAIPQTASAAQISTVDIRLDDPVASYCPDLSFTASDSHVMQQSVQWRENSVGFDAVLGSNDEFRAGLAYKLTIWVRALAGFSFSRDIYGGLAATFTLNGRPFTSAEAKSWDSDGFITDVTLTYEFDPLPGRTVSSATITSKARQKAPTETFRHFSFNRRTTISDPPVEVPAENTSPIPTPHKAAP